MKSSKRKISLLVSTLVFIGAFSVSNSNYANNNAHAAVVSYKQVSFKITSISLNKTTDTLIVGKKDRLIATSVPGSLKNKAITWTSSDSNIVTVKNGEVKAVSAGNAVVTAASTDGSVSASCSITVNPVVEITGISLNKTSDALTVGATDTLSAAITPSNATNQNLRWISSNKRVVKVEKGVVTAVSEGTAIIIATSPDGRYAASCTVTVTAPAAAQ